MTANDSRLRGLHAAFSEYTSKTWDTEEWSAFGLSTGTTDVLNNHPLLYRSLRFGDDDYAACVWEVVPDALAAAADSSEPLAQAAVAADYAPELREFELSTRTRRFFEEFCSQLAFRLPDVWFPRTDNESPGATADDAEVLELATNDAVEVADERAPDRAGSGASSVPSVVAPAQLERTAPASIFIVHGHDTTTLREVQVAVHRMTGIMPTVLADKPSRGDTVIEKFERYGDASSVAIILLTPDDEGKAVSDSALRHRARQNVVLEFGYFLGRLGRDRVIPVNAGIEVPSDLAGVVYIPFSDNWESKLRRELRAADLIIID